MPSLEEINNKNKNKFRKREYRPWNIEGNSTIDVMPTVSNGDMVIELDPLLIKNWDYHDRPLNELGDVENLAAEFKTIGQQQPCIVRLLQDNHQFKYELIVGERRWHAAKLAKVRLKVVVKNLVDTEAAIIQASENSSRKDLSDFAKGTSYARLIEDGILEQKDLIERLYLSKQQVSRLLSFSKIPQQVIDAIADMTKVSARTAEQIKQLCVKGTLYEQAIIKFSRLLREGKIGHEKLAKLVENEITEGSNVQKSKYLLTGYICNDQGQKIILWKVTKNKLNIIIPQNLESTTRNKALMIEELTTMIKDYIEKEDDTDKILSPPRGT